MKENKTALLSGIFLLVIIVTVITCNSEEEVSFPVNTPEAVVEEVKKVVETKAEEVKEEVKAKVVEMLPEVKELPIALPKVIEEAVAPVELPELPVEEAPADSTTTEPTTNEGDE